MRSPDPATRKYRNNAAAAVATVIAFFGTVPLATSKVYLLPLLLAPAAIGLGAWRAGTDVTPAGLRVRALVASRLIPWSDVAALVPAGRRAYAVTGAGRRVRLPAVPAAALPAIAGLETGGTPTAGAGAGEELGGTPTAGAGAGEEPDGTPTARTGEEPDGTPTARTGETTPTEAGTTPADAR